MKLVRYFHPATGVAWGFVDEDEVHPLATGSGAETFLTALLQWPDPVAVVRSQVRRSEAPLSLGALADGAPDPATPHLLPPLDRQEVWAAGVTYLRSKVARMEESEGAARCYDLVYDADRPELFYKGSATRTVGPGAPIRIRQDARWNVPEPELALLLAPSGRRVGYTLGNDVSSRDIEGANPLYLPQAKVYRQSCALGPAILLEPDPAEHREFPIALSIQRGGAVVFAGETTTGRMKRSFAELAAWLFRDNVFPHGVFLLTGTGIVPGEEFTLLPGDRVTIASPPIGTLANDVIQGP